MSLRALLLSPDDQAVHAITSVLEEMSVSCDRPLDGATAAKKLNSEHFDLVVVDCDNLPAAKLIFDVCRRSHAGGSVPVAVVDGRVGLPTAFRLGAELILTKPVAKDQARLTIRTAVSRTKKDQPVHDAKPADAANAANAETREENTVPKALAAAAGAVSSGALQTTVAVSEPAIAPPPPTAKAETRLAAFATETMAPMKSSVTAAIATAMPPVVSKPVVPVITTLDRPEKQTSASAVPTPSFEQQLSEDPVMAELENAAPQQSTARLSFEKPKPDRSRGLWIGTLLLAVAGGAGYAAWMYQPGVRKFIEPRIEQGKTLLGLQPSTSAVRPGTPSPAAKPVLVQQPASPTTSSPVQQSSTEPSAATEAATVPAASTANTPITTTSTNVAAPSLSPAISTNSSASEEPEQKAAVTSAPTSEFSEAKNVVILSSKGAEKRLLHHVKPVVPAKARQRSAEATVVLKALIDENGAVKALQPVEGDAAITDAAMKAVKQWRYKPYTRDGKALPFQTIVLVDLQ